MAFSYKAVFAPEGEQPMKFEVDNTGTTLHIKHTVATAERCWQSGIGGMVAESVPVFNNEKTVTE